MGDSTCVLQPFSYTSSAILHESKQGNPLLMHGLGDSVSFGRFMTESLAWEKWSTFSSSSSSSHNRYVEEAERYAQPGSVAQKKAFFEAHYKRIAAAKKAAADAAATGNAEAVPAVINHLAPPLPPPPPPPAAAVKDVEIKGVDWKLENSGVVAAEAKGEMLPHGDLDVKEEHPTANSKLVSESLENQGMVSPESEEHPRMIEKPLLLEQKCSSDQEAPPLVKNKKKSAFSSLKSSVYRKTPRVPLTPAKQLSITPRTDKQNNRSTASYNATTPILGKKQALYFTDKKQNCTPKKSSPVKQLCNLISPGRRADNKKMDNSSTRIVPDSSSSKMSRNYATPKMEKAAKLSNSDASMATPCSANTRTKTTPGDGSKTTGPKWNMFSAVYSKSLTACRNKLQSPTLSSTPFQLRTEERAARRKQKLEDKFNSKDVEKVQLQQTSLKEKAELELRKLRQSFCFKARPLPEFYKERETQQAQTNRIKKNNPVTTQLKSPKLGRKPSFRAKQQGGKDLSLPSSTNTENRDRSILKHFSSEKKKNGPTPPASSSLQEMINRENASPNIQ